MASFKEIQQSARPLPHRPSMSSTNSIATVNGRHSHSRSSSNSLAIGPANANHRVARRKSVTTQLSNAAAAAAILGEVGDKAMPLPTAVRSRRNTMSKHGASRPVIGSLPSPPGSLPTHKFLSMHGLPGRAEHAVDDDSNEISPDEADAFQKARVRRASDGHTLAKDGAKGELRCQQCGKGYKHSSCLTKHLWEHTPEWSFTSKLLISKHQQVQLLEAASVLVNMNGTPATPPDSGRDLHSDRESASPSAFEGSSDQQDGRSSADTTPPPQLEGYSTYQTHTKRYSSGSGIARSYQSSNAYTTPGSMPLGADWDPTRRPSYTSRRMSSDADHELAAAVDMLSCSIGSHSGSSRTIHLPADAPPVPPLPEQYLAHANLSRSFMNSFPNHATESNMRGARHDEHDAKMENSGESGQEDEEDDKHSRARSDEEEELMFGRMDE